MQQGMDAMVERSDEVSALRETVAMLETRVNEITKTKDILVEHKPVGRPRRPQ